MAGGAMVTADHGLEPHRASRAPGKFLLAARP